MAWYGQLYGSAASVTKALIDAGTNATVQTAFDRAHGPAFSPSRCALFLLFPAGMKTFLSDYVSIP